MNLPILPTDNLYKFLALSGITLMVISLFYPVRLINEIQLQIVDTKTQIALTTLEISGLERDTDVLTSQKNPSPTLAAELRERSNKLGLKNIADGGAANRLDALQKQFAFVWRLGQLGIWAGLCLSILGFVPWYVLVQAPADRILRKQAADA